MVFRIWVEELDYLDFAYGWVRRVDSLIVVVGMVNWWLAVVFLVRYLDEVECCGVCSIYGELRCMACFIGGRLIFGG